MVSFDLNSGNLYDNFCKSSRTSLEVDSGFLENSIEHNLEEGHSPSFENTHHQQQQKSIKSEMLNSFINNFHEDNIHCENFYFGNINDFDNEHGSLSDDVITSYSSSSYESGSESFYSCRSNSDPFMIPGNLMNEHNILNDERDNSYHKNSRTFVRQRDPSLYEDSDTSSETRKKRSLIKSCLYPETNSDDVIFQTSKENSQSDLCLNKNSFDHSSALTVRLREATTTAKRELRKKLQSWSDIFLTNSDNSDRFTSYMTYSHSQEELNQNFILKPFKENIHSWEKESSSRDKKLRNHAASFHSFQEKKSVPESEKIYKDENYSPSISSDYCSDEGISVNIDSKSKCLSYDKISDTTLQRLYSESNGNEDSSLTVLTESNDRDSYQTEFSSGVISDTTDGKARKYRKNVSLLSAKSFTQPREDVFYLDEENETKNSFDETKENQDLNFAPKPDDLKLALKKDDLKSLLRFGHPLFRTSKEKKRAKLRESKYQNFGSEDSYGNSTERKGIYDISQLCNNVTKQRRLRHTNSDMSKSQSSTPYSTLTNDSSQRQSLGRQYSSPHPIKERPLHRLPDYSACILEEKSSRTKSSSSNLRRSVSQPLDLDKSFQAQVSLLKIRIPDETTVQKGRRRPSVGNLLSDDNSSDDDDDLDNGELQQGFKSLDEELIVFAEALWDHVSLDADELVFKAGDLITVIDSSDKDWWWGRIGQKSGWFPASFVRLLVNQSEHENEDCDTYVSTEDDSRKLSLFSISQDQVRANVISEIVSTERDYVKHLRDVVEGYLRQVRKRPDMFSEETINVIFGNMEALYDFHVLFLKELESCIDFEAPHHSCIGECFIHNRSNFEIYSEYCNNHPSAVSELQELYQDQRFVHFFEACRLLQQMIDISLDGFLLTPVQKICKYPLQLQELLKYTRANHVDYPNVLGAMRTMREVALLVNERRRRMECLEKIASWQRTVEGWEGPELLEDSSQLIHQGEVIKGIGGAWPKEVHLFLFDHQMVYCKKDLLKRNTFVYRGRINTDLCEVIDIPDDPLRSATFHHSWKIHCLDKGKTYVFTSKTESDKSKWLQAFKKERSLVAMDESTGFVVSEKQKQVARMTAKNQKSRPKRPRIKNDNRKEVMTFAQAQQLISTEKRDESRSNSLPSRGPSLTHAQKKKGHWFSFGGNKKSRNGPRSQKHTSFLVS